MAGSYNTLVERLVVNVISGALITFLGVSAAVIAVSKLAVARDACVTIFNVEPESFVTNLANGLNDVTLGALRVCTWLAA